VVFVTDFPAAKVLVFALPNRPRIAAHFVAVDLHFIVPSGWAEDTVDLMLQRAGFVIIVVTVFERLDVGVVRDDDFDWITTVPFLKVTLHFKHFKRRAINMTRLKAGGVLIAPTDDAIFDDLVIGIFQAVIDVTTGRQGRCGA